MYKNKNTSIKKHGLRSVLTAALVLSLALGMLPVQAFSVEDASVDSVEDTSPENTSSQKSPQNPDTDSENTEENTKADTEASPQESAAATSTALATATNTTSTTLAESTAISPLAAPSSYRDAFKMVADNNTGLSHNGVFTATSNNDGRIWTDKSVDAGTGPAADEFSVTLSAMAQSVQSEQEQSVPSDTVFVLDTSFSMIGELDTGESRVAVMVDALNDAIATLMRENPDNRIAVVAYGGLGVDQQARVTPVLALARYDEVKNGDYFSLASKARIKVNSNITGSKLLVTGLIPVVGGTATQWGIYEAAQVFLNQATIPTYTVGGARVPPKPNIVMLTDGEPTYGWADYDFSEAVSKTGSGYTSGDGNNVDMGALIMTVLTASYFKQKVTEKYYGANAKQSAAFYTIGLGVSDSEEARATLDPMGDIDDDSLLNAGELSTSYDHEMYNMQDVLDDFINTGQTSFATLQFRESSARRVETIQNSQIAGERVESYDYVDYYAAAESAADLREFFKDITQMIVSVGSYPTSVLSDPEDTYTQWQTSFADYTGAVVFSDVVGEYMEVKDANYLLYNKQQYNGAIFAHRIMKENPSRTVPQMGAAAPTTAKAMDALFGSQLFFSNLQEGRTSAQMSAIIEDLLESALAAGDGSTNGGESGIYYRSATDFGNRIRYYADADGKWTGNYFASNGSVNLSLPPGTVCTVDQYFANSTTHNAVSSNPSDLTYSVFQIVTALSDTTLSEKNFRVDSGYQITPMPLTEHHLKQGQQMVRWAIPASLLPLRSVKKAADGTYSVIETEPLRFNYSVGLKSNLSLDDVASDYAGIKDGKYYFYSNAWMEQENASLAHFVPAADNPYYQNGRTETSPAFANNTATSNFATQGPTKNAANAVWYYGLGNNGRMEIQRGDLEVTKTWDTILDDSMLQDVYVQLYLDGNPLGDPKLLSEGRRSSATWEDLQLYATDAGAGGSAKPLAYSVLEGEGSTQGSFDPYDIDGQWRIDYVQPTLNGAGNGLLAEVVNKPRGDQNWILDVSKSFEVNGTPLNTAEIDAMFRNGSKSLDFYLFQKITFDRGGGNTEDVYMQTLLGEWGDDESQYLNRPLRYPDDFANGQRSLWFAGGASDPAEMTFLLVEIADSEALPDNYDYRSNDPVSVAGLSEISNLGSYSLGSWEMVNGVPTGADIPFNFSAEESASAHAFEMSIQSGQTATFDFSNYLIPAQPPHADLTLQKTVTGIDPDDPDNNFAATFIVEGWESAEAAATGDLGKRVFYEEVDWDEVAADPSGLDFGSVPLGHYTITEIAATHIQAEDGTIYDRNTVDDNSTGATDVQITHDSNRNFSRITFNLAANANATISLQNNYTPRPQLTIEKAFVPLPNPLPEDIAFSIFDASGKLVRFVSHDAFDGASPNGGTYTIKNLPAGTYTVSESGGEALDGYYPVTTTISPSAGITVDPSGTIGTVTLTAGSTTPVTVRFTNTYTPLPQGSLTIKKQLTGYPDDWGVKSTTSFRVKIKDVTDTDSSKQGYLEFDGQNSFTGQISSTGGTELTISEAERVTVFGLTVGRRYRVEEVVPEGAAFNAPTYTSKGQVIDDLTVANDALDVTVINDYPRSTAGALVVTKDLLGFYGDWGVTGATRFRVRIYDMQERNYLWFIEGSGASGESSGSGAGGSQTLASESAQTLASASGGIYWCVGNEMKGFSEAVERSKAIYTELPLTTDTSLLLQNLWADSDGWRYRIEEVVPPSEEGRYENGGAAEVVLFQDGTGALSSGTNTHATIENLFTRQGLGNLVISKRLAGSPADWGVHDDTTFKARVREADGARRYLTFDAKNNYSGTNDSGSLLDFSHNTPAVLTGIPGGRYVVEESTPQNTSYYTVTYEGDVAGANGEVDLASDGPAKIVSVVNTYPHDTGRMILSKSLSGYSEEEGGTGATVFKAQIHEKANGQDGQENLLYFTLIEEDLNLYRCVGSSAGISDPAYADIPVDNRTLFDTIPFSADNPALLDNLWIGVSYRVEELDGEQYAVKYTGNEQELPQDGINATGNIQTAAINTYTSGETPPPGGGENPPPGGEDDPPPPDPGGDSPENPPSGTLGALGDFGNTVLWWITCLSAVAAALGLGVLGRHKKRSRYRVYGYFGNDSGRGDYGGDAEKIKRNRYRPSKRSG